MKIIALIIATFIIGIGVIQAEEEISVTFPHLKKNSLATNDLLYFNLSNKQLNEQLNIYYLKNGQKIKIVPFIIESENKKDFFGCIWIDSFLNPVFTGDTVSITFEIVDNEGKKKELLSKNFNILQDQIITKNIINKEFIKSLSNFLHHCCSENDYIWALDFDDMQPSTIEKLSTTDSKLGEVCTLIRLYFELNKEITAQEEAAFEAVTKEKNNHLEKNDDMNVLTLNKILKTNIAGKISKKQQLFLSKLKERRYSVLWSIFYPLYISTYLRIGQLEKSTVLNNSLDNLQAKDKINSFLQKYYLKDGLIKRKEKKALLLYPGNQNVLSFVRWLNNQKISQNDKQKHMSEYLRKIKNKFTVGDIIRCFEATIKTFKIGDVVTFCDSYIHKNSATLEENSLLQKYENAIIEFYTKNELELSSNIFRTKGNIFFDSTYARVRTIPLLFYSEILISINNPSKSFYKFFNKKLSEKSGRDNIMTIFKRQYPKKFEEMGTILKKHFGSVEEHRVSNDK